MKQHSLIVLLLFTMNLVSAQIDFTAADPQPDLIEVYGGSFASGDIDGDGDKDLIMGGLGAGRESALYVNDGLGNFTEVTSTPFPTASDTVTEFVDLDGDGDLDLYLSGVGNGIGAFAHIYLNDGAGQFTQQANPELPAFRNRGAALEDVDNDGDIDIFISAEDDSNQINADVYLNDGNANFTAAGSTAFVPLKFASVAFIDVEDDGDADIMVSGEDLNDNARTDLYLNDGSGNYTMDTNANFVQLQGDDIDVADTDNDGDLDILMSGTEPGIAPRTILYVNDGTGQFTELTNTGLQQTFAGTNAIADLDNDGDLDLVIIGSQDGGLPNIFNIVYENLGNNNFVQVDIIGGEYIAACVVEDFNGDDLLDIIIQGFVEDTTFYWNTSQLLGDSDELGGLNKLEFYPNPTTNTVRFLSITEIDTITVFNVIGQEVQSMVVQKNEHQLDLKNLPAGPYFARVTSGASYRVVKLVKI